MSECLQAAAASGADLLACTWLGCGVGIHQDVVGGDAAPERHCAAGQESHVAALCHEVTSTHPLLFQGQLAF